MVHLSHHRTLGLIALGIGIGVFLNFKVQGISNNFLSALIPLLLGFFYYSKTKIFTISLGFLIALALGMLRIGISLDHPKRIESKLGIVEIQQLISSTEYYNSYRVKQIDSRVNREHSLLLKLKTSDSIKLIPSDCIQYWGVINRLKYPTHPGGFKYDNYLNKLGVFNELKTTSYVKIDENNSIKRYAYKLQEQLAYRLKKLLKSPREQSTALAMLIGVKDTGFKSIQNSYSKTGVSHLLAISGLHTAIVFSMIFTLLFPLGFLLKGKKIRWILSLTVLWGFALVSGWSYSVIRACLLLSFFGLSRLLQRPNQSLHFLIVAFIINILINPFSLFQVGFQMSYSAVFFILWLGPVLRRQFKHRYRWLDKILELTAISLSAQIGVLPLSLYYFGALPTHFLVGNILIIPLMGIVIYSGFLSLFFHFLAPYFELLLFYLNEFIEKLSIDSLSVKVTIDDIQLLSIYILLILLVSSLKTTSIKLLKAALILILGIQIYSIYKDYHRYKKEVIIIIGSYDQVQLIYKKGRQLQTFSNQELSTDTLKDLSRYYHTSKTVQYPLSHAYKLNYFSLVHIGSQSSYPINKQTDLLLLSQNPKLHLERLIDSLNPTQIVSDKSNAPWNVNRWKRTAKAKKIPLIDLRSEGVYLKEF